ncbi:MAG TPA: hypothetical protein VLF39_03785 [Candidatus Saccharimonadales bacterium]|nr:hypothetical protein [Candidatus Saccharimonadales bacterium]
MTKLSSTKQVADDPKTLIVTGVIGIILAYLMFTRAVDTGSLFQYGIVILLLILSTRFLIKAVQIKRNGK